MQSKPIATTNSNLVLASKYCPSSKVVPSSHGQEIEQLKKQNIAAQMRAKHLGQTQTVPKFKIGSNNNAPTIGNPVIKSIVSTTPPAIVHQNVSSTVEMSPPEENYVISDREDDDDSDNDSCESGKPKQQIPRWAHKERLLKALDAQFRRTHDTYEDPDEIFGEVETCNLKDIFGSPRKGKLQRRTSSGNWTKDRVTSAEKIAYKHEHKLKLTKQPAY
jgi:Inner centromere protein, ARK binding region